MGNRRALHEQLLQWPDASTAAAWQTPAVPVRIVAHEPARGRAPFRILAEDASGLGLVLAFFGSKFVLELVLGRP